MRLKKLLQLSFFFFMVFVGEAYAGGGLLLFVSFSMPEKLMVQTLEDATNHQIPVLLNGLIDDSMPKTLDKIMYYTQKVPNLSLQIDPESFQKYQIKRVPALVADFGQGFDVVYGNNSLDNLLDEIKRKGEGGL